MKTFEKNYIGKGKQVASMDIVRISCRIEDIIKHAHQYKDEEWISFEVARLQNPDQFGNTHTAYVNKLVDDPQDSKKQKKAPQKAGKPAKSTKKAKTAKVEETLPF